MKLSLRIGVVCLVTGLILGTGCQQASTATPPPDFSTASAASVAKYSAVTNSVPSQSGLTTPPTGISVSGSPSTTPFDVVLTYTDYTTVGGTKINGTLHVAGSTSASGGTIHEYGKLTLSGATTGSVAMDITMVMSVSGSTMHITTTGTVTIDGTTYGVNSKL